MRGIEHFLHFMLRGESEIGRGGGGGGEKSEAAKKNDQCECLWILTSMRFQRSLALHFLENQDSRL